MDIEQGNDPEALWSRGAGDARVFFGAERWCELSEVDNGLDGGVVSNWRDVLLGVCVPNPTFVECVFALYVTCVTWRVPPGRADEARGVAVNRGIVTSRLVPAVDCRLVPSTNVEPVERERVSSR